ncbi:hypothetical protein SDC9_51327 [bioreactor metagenome]|uniref:Uncharacterized protein n=1 Tax=bioreactor metagenome TaxID=1076179 RepID=A0A644WMA1_9ZZZZ
MVLFVGSNSRTAFLFIYHTTKEGNFRGKNENAHEVDVIVEVAEDKATGNGRFRIWGNKLMSVLTQ